MSVGIDKLASELQKVIEEKDKNKKSPYDTEAEVVRVDSDVVWVKIPGGVDETPAQKTVNAKEGDKVQVRVSGGRAFLVGNGTNPPTDDTVANVAIDNARDANQNATAAGLAAEQAIDSANTANEAAAKAQTDAGIAHTAATEAKEDAADAKTAATEAKEDAGIAHTAATEAKADAADAKTSANEAKEDAAAASTAATEAKNDAAKANTAANDSLSQLSIVEDVVGTLNWITTHATYKASADTEVHAGKWYFIKSGSTYNVVTNPTGNPSAKGYYEVDTIDEAVSNYVASHIALTSDGLYLTKDGSGYKILLANDGLKVYDPEGHLVSTFGESIILDSSRPQTIGNNNVYIKYYDKNNDGTPDSLTIKADEFLLSSGKTIQEELEGVENWFYSVAPTTSNEPAKNWATDKLKEQHLRDIYFDTTSGKSYRWAKEGTTYKWVEIEDVELAALAKDLHDNYPPRSEFTVAPNQIQSTVSAAQTAATNAANTATDNKLKSYYTKTETDSQITQKADSITSTVSSTYETKTDASSKLTEAKGDAATKANKALSDAKADTTEKLKSYYTKKQTDSEISQKANEISLSVSEEKIAELISAKEASGNIVHIEDASEYPALECKIPLEPIQSLNGYDKPWVGGAGKNKLPKGTSSTSSGITFSVQDDGRVKVTGTATATAFWGVQFTIPAGTYVLNGCPSGGGGSSYLMDIRNGVGGTGITGIGGDTGNGTTFTIASALTAYLNIRIASGYSAPSSGLMLSPMLRLASETDVAYAPYSNICPISGRTEVVTQRTGKNLLPYPYTNNSGTANGITYSTTADGRVTISGTATATAWVRLYGGFATETSLKKPVPSWITADTDYVLSGGQSSNFYVQANLYSGTSSVGQWIDTGSGKSFSLTSEQISNADSFAVFIRVNSGQTVNATISPMIEEGSAKTSWTPYNGTTYTTALGRTVYGGTLDVVSGVLTVDRTFVETTWGNFQANVDIGNYSRRRCDFTPMYDVSKIARESICNVSPYATGWTTDNLHFYLDITTPFPRAWLYLPKETADSTVVQIVYPLATPQTYQLTPQQIELLQGVNNVWADSDNTYLKYVTMNSDMLSLMDKSNADLSRAKAEIKVTTDGISSEVSKKVGNSEVISKINQSAETVKIQASKVEIDGTVTFNAIKAKTDAAYDAKGAASTVQTNLNNLQIGGRNLVWDTEWKHISTRWSNWGSPTTREIITINGKRWLHLVTTASPYQGYSQAQDKRNGYGEIEAGDKVIISYSAYAKTAGQSCAVGCHWRNSSGTIVAQDWFRSYLTTTEKRYTSAVFTIPNDAVGFNIMIGDNSTIAQEIWMSQVKLEFGNKATDWTPAPEDGAYGKMTYATCATAEDEAAKVAVLSDGNLTLTAGAAVAVTFEHANEVDAPTLNVGGTGAKAIVSYAGDALTDNEYSWAAGACKWFVYDGTNWRMNDEGSLSSIETIVDSLETTKGDLTNLTVVVGGNSDDISDLQSDTAANTAKLDTQEDAIATLQTNQTNIQSSVTNLNQTTVNLSDRVSSIEGAVIINPTEPSVTVKSQSGAVKVYDTQITLKGGGNTVSFADSESFNSKRMVCTDFMPRYMTFTGSSVTMTGELALVARRNGHVSIKKVT